MSGDITHEVFNQSKTLGNYNLYSSDSALRDAVACYGASWAEADLNAHGERCGRIECYDWGFLANDFRPQFKSHDRQGYRVDEVHYHDAYHQLMTQALKQGLHASPWIHPGTGAHVARAAKYYLQAQIEAGHGCPVTMTFASVPALRLTPSIADYWLPKVLASEYDPRNVPYFEKQSVTVGMGMTEKQGGSDVRSNTTSAIPLELAGGGSAYELTGHKWFTSAPMCDAFLMLAQTGEGLSCFLVPRWRPDGSRNAIRIQRLKNKMGNVANASSEIELHAALGWMIGDPGRGIASIIEMVAMTRFDCMIGSSAAQRQALSQAFHHAEHRMAFGDYLIDQPLMRNVLADLQLEVEGSVAFTMRMAAALDRSLADGGDQRESLLLRLGLPVGKYWICKRTPSHVYEAMECLGGNAVTEDFIMARLYRDAPVNAIWEGSGNIQALDLLRALSRSPESLEVWFEELQAARGNHPVLDAALENLEKSLSDGDDMPFTARRLADRLAVTMQASLLLRYSKPAVADAFIRSRLGQADTHAFGTLPEGIDVATILDRASPIS